MRQGKKDRGNSFLGAVSFYSIIPLPKSWILDFQPIARWAPLVGLLLGGLISLLDLILTWCQIPILPRSALTVAFGIFLTGGLHLDGVGDTADGLAVQNPQKRLIVMRDSFTGAFGVMAITLVILLKTLALSEISQSRWFVLMAIGGWGRWGQVMAIALYPYLRATGKGAFHKQYLRVPQDVLSGFLLLLGFCGGFGWLYPEGLGLAIQVILGGSFLSLFTGFWLYRQLKGHTGDTYGAVVEWTEALLLCLLTRFYSN